MPSPEKVVSGAPSGLKRAMTTRCTRAVPSELRTQPAATTFPSGWIATEVTSVWSPRAPSMGMKAAPSPPKLVSGVPSGLKRVAPMPRAAGPPATTLPSGCAARSAPAP